MILLGVGFGEAMSMQSRACAAFDQRLPSDSQTERSERRVGGAGPESSGTLELYGLHCAECHGAKGTGRPVRKTTPEIPDFTDASWQARRKDAQFLASILDGKGADMPGFRDDLGDEQAQALVDFVRAFAPGSSSTEQIRPEEVATSRDFTSKLIRWLGNFHSPSVHFPIALLTAAAVAELLRMATGSSAFDPVSRFCVWSASLSALGAALLGWFMAGFRLSDPSWVMTTHRWLGTSVAASAPLVLVLCEHSRQPRRRRTLISFRVVLFALAGVVAVTGFFGGRSSSESTTTRGRNEHRALRVVAYRTQLNH
jgi:mono/diheme cytochrome c family protein/uncharacterized membrane protein